VLLVCCRYFPRQFVEPTIVNTPSQVTRVRSNEEFRFAGRRFPESSPQASFENRLDWLPGLSRDSRDAFGKISFEGQNGPHGVVMLCRSRLLLRFVPLSGEAAC